MSLKFIIIWLMVGALAGSLTGLIVNRKSGRLANLMIGLVGAVIGGYIFRRFRIDLGLGHITINFENLIAATVGALILIVFLRLIHKLWNYMFRKMDESLENDGA